MAPNVTIESKVYQNVMLSKIVLPDDGDVGDGIDCIHTVSSPAVNTSKSSQARFQSRLGQVDLWTMSWWPQSRWPWPTPCFQLGFNFYISRDVIHCSSVDLG